jgi:hypothetical protein
MNVPFNLSPFRLSHQFEPLNSLGIRKGGKVVGWLINHRIDSFTIQYSSIFVKAELQSQGLVLPLIWKAMDIQFNGDNMMANRCEFVIEPKTKEMMLLSKNRFSNYCDEAFTQYQ